MKNLLDSLFALQVAVPIFSKTTTSMKRISLCAIFFAIALFTTAVAENVPPALPDNASLPPMPSINTAPPEPPPTVDDSKVFDSVKNPNPKVEQQSQPADTVSLGHASQEETKVSTTSAEKSEVSDKPAGKPVSIEALEQLTTLMKENQKLQEELERRRGDPIDFSLQPKAPMPPMNATASNSPARQNLMSFLRERYAGTNVDVYLQGEYVVVRIPEATYRIGEAKMPLSIRSRLKPIADAAAQFESNFDLQVEGHSDASPVRRNAGKSNWTVAFARAESVARELETMKVPDRSLAITSRGSGLLIDQANKFSQINRRVELVFAPKRSLVPIPSATKPPGHPTVAPVLTSVPSKKNIAPATVTDSKIRLSDVKAPAPDDVIDLPVLVVNAPTNESTTPVIPQPAR